MTLLDFVQTADGELGEFCLSLKNYIKLVISNVQKSTSVSLCSANYSGVMIQVVSWPRQVYLKGIELLLKS